MARSGLLASKLRARRRLQASARPSVETAPPGAPAPRSRAETASDVAEDVPEGKPSGGANSDSGWERALATGAFGRVLRSARAAFDSIADAASARGQELEVPSAFEPDEEQGAPARVQSSAASVIDTVGAEIRGPGRLVLDAQESEQLKQQLVRGELSITGYDCDPVACLDYVGEAHEEREQEHEGTASEATPSESRAEGASPGARCEDPSSASPSSEDRAVGDSSSGVHQGGSDEHPPAERTEGSLAVVDAPPAAPLERWAPKRYGPRDVFEAFLRRRTKNTLTAYKQDVEAFASWLGVTSTEATQQLLSSPAVANDLALRWLDTMQSKGLASATQARRLSALKSLVRMGQQLGVVQWNLTIEGPKIQPYRDTRGPGVEQLQRLFAACGSGLEGVRDRAILMMAATHALRRFELAAMRVNDIDRKTGEPRLRVVGKGEKLVWITLTPDSLRAVDEWLAAWREKTAGLEQSDGPVFRSLSNRRWGEPLSPKGIYAIVTRIGRRAGVRVWPHGIRHTSITAFLDQTNGNLREGQKFARHADPRTTKLYDDSRQDTIQEGTQRVAALWAGARKS